MTEQFETLSTRAQDTVATAARTWTDAVQSVTDAYLAAQPDPKTVVDRWFDVAQQILDEQRRFATSVLTASAATTETVVEQAKTAAAQTVDAVQGAATAAAQRTTRNAKAAAKN